MVDSAGGVVPAAAARPDIMVATTTPRPTPKPVRASFGEVLAAGANVAVSGAQTVLSSLPGSPVSAPGIRQGGGGAVASPLVAEGPGGSGTLTPSTSIGIGGGLGLGSSGTGTGLGVGTTGTSGSTDPTSSMSAALAQSAELSMQYLQLQQQEDSQQRLYEALSNMEKTRHDTAHNAIGNIGQ